MNARIPIRAYSETPDERAEDDCCDCCCSVPVVDVIDGDRMCQECADRHAARPVDPNDDLLPLSHPVMREAFADLAKLSRGQRAFVRERRG